MKLILAGKLLDLVGPKRNHNMKSAIKEFLSERVLEKQGRVAGER